MLIDDEVRAAIGTLPERDRKAILQLMLGIEQKRQLEEAREHFLPFVKKMWPSFIEGAHHKKMAEVFEKVARGELKRVIINLPPRHTKSEFASYLFPAWFIGQYPEKKVIQSSHTAELAMGFGRQVRNLIAGPQFREVFPDVKLSQDSKAAGRWNTNSRGDYFAVGVGGAVAGKGADILIIDDPHALEISTPVPTPKGFVEIQDLNVGDEVYGPDGKTTKIIAKSDVWHDRELYSVTTSDGEEILCDAAHLWGVNSDTSLAKARVDAYAARYLAEWPKMNRPIIPRWQPVEYPEAKLPIDPWVLGAWLGDGTASSGRITAHPEDQDYMMGQFKLAGYEVSGVTTDGFTFNVYGLMGELRAVGVLNNKHVPEIYLTASVEQRMALLQGLIDTDGSVSKTGQCGFYNCNEGLVRAVVEILHSLGVKAQMRTYHDRRDRYGSVKPNHRVVFKLKDAARMPRKAMYTRTPMDKRSRSIEVENTGQTGSVQCITVERDDGLFLCGRGYVVTHNSEQEAQTGEHNPAVYDNVYSWYTSGPRQRLQPNGAIIIVMTRWSLRDLTGQILDKAAKDGSMDEWEVIELPAIMPSGNALWPEFWSLPALEAIKRDIPINKWNSQYQQSPTSEEGALIKRDWWRKWEKPTLPPCEAILQSWDTAFERTQRANYSACTTWGIFTHEDENGNKLPNLILLDAFKGKFEFPELKKEAREAFLRFEPDQVIIERRASGAPLLFELRAMGIPVSDFQPSRGQDKIARVNAITDMFASGFVWAPDTDWAAEVIEECAVFPSGKDDDYVDSTSQALLRFRQGGWIGTSNDDNDDEEVYHRRREYY